MILERNKLKYFSDLNQIWTLHPIPMKAMPLKGTHSKRLDINAPVRVLHYNFWTKEGKDRISDTWSTLLREIFIEIEDNVSAVKTT